LPSAAIIAVGSEMLGPTRLDTNSLKLTAALESFAVAVVRKSIVGDTLRDLADEIRFALGRADVLAITGGLGPTEDDLTREALAEALDLSMEVDPAIIERLEKRFAARGWKMPEVNKKQANVFRGQTTLANERGTAPGFHIEIRWPLAVDRSPSHEPRPTANSERPTLRHVWVFPGVPHELEWMIETYLTPWLASAFGSRSRFRRVLKVVGLGESLVEEKIKPYYDAHRDEEPLTILATSGQTELHILADGDEPAARAKLAARENELLALLGERVYGFDDDTLEGVVGALLRERGATLAVAESCTGGLLSSRITDVAGSSAYFLGGGVCYTAALKTSIAGVDPALIREHGEVSEEVAVALARGIRERVGATYGVGVTGIAGPSGGTPEKPVGTVHIAVAGPSSHEHRRMFWPMGRALFKLFTTQSALDLLRLFMLRSRAG
jgi:nicotinamide-nucleotide amidase